MSRQILGVRRTDPNTSHKAAQLGVGRAKTLRETIRDAIAYAFPEDMNCGEVEEKIEIYRDVTKRMSELVREGWIEVTDETRPSPITGRQQQVYVITEAGFEAAGR